MPELPEVEVLVRHLRPLLCGREIHSVDVRRTKVIFPTTVSNLHRTLVGSTFAGLRRRGKYLVFSLRHPRRQDAFKLLGHLGMTGRIYLQPHETPLARHAAVVVRLDHRELVFEDTRYFGRFTLDLTPLHRLGPEPLSARFTPALLAAALHRSAQSIKVKLLDQSLAAGIGNIYASEALFRAGIHPEIKARDLTVRQVRALVGAIRSVLSSAIRWGSTVPLDWAGTGLRDGLFYYGRTDHADTNLTERLLVYGRDAQPCRRCRASIRRVILGHRSAFFCPRCQR